MAFEINDLRRAATGAMYVSPARLCVTADDEICAEDDPRAVRLLVGKGCELTAPEAARYGLITEAPEPASGDAPPEASGDGAEIAATVEEPLPEGEKPRRTRR